MHALNKSAANTKKRKSAIFKPTMTNDAASLASENRLGE